MTHTVGPPTTCPVAPPCKGQGRLTGILLAIALAIVGGLAPSGACAWNAAGHRLIAAMAWDGLTVAQRRAVHALLLAHPALPQWQAAAHSSAARDVFIESSSWPDQLRRQAQPPSPGGSREREIGPRRTWHYVNIPLADWQAGPQGGALHRALPYLAGRLGDGKLPAAERADALVWLNHLIGDAHQPLHVASRFDGARRGKHDAGGNGLAVLLPSASGRPSNLHRVWDNLPGSGSLRGGHLDRRAARLATRGPSETPAGGSAVWLAESHALASAGVYPSGDPPLRLSREYLAWAQARADAQLVHAARRLAASIADALSAAGPAPERAVGRAAQ